MSISLTDQDKTTLRIAAYGAIALLSTAGGSSHKIAVNGTIALTSATGLVGHVLADYPKGNDVNGRSVAEIAGSSLPALTTAMSLLRSQAPAEADNFRSTILTAIEAATHHSKPTPIEADVIRKITEALDAPLNKRA